MTNISKLEIIYGETCRQAVQLNLVVSFLPRFFFHNFFENFIDRLDNGVPIC